MLKAKIVTFLWQLVSHARGRKLTCTKEVLVPLCCAPVYVCVATISANKLATSRPLVISWSELQWGCDKASDEVTTVDLFHRNGFEACCRFTRKKSKYGCIPRGSQVTSCWYPQSPIGQLSWRHRCNFDRCISRPTGVKSPLKWHNQPGQKLKDLRKSKVQTTTTKVLNTLLLISHQPPALFSSVMCNSP